MAQLKDRVPKILLKDNTVRVKVYSNWWGICKGCVSLAVFCTEVTLQHPFSGKADFCPNGYTDANGLCSVEARSRDFQ